MFSDAKGSPSKGKGKEESRWQSGWWDFYPLVERSQRPLVWSPSSAIFTAHPTQPIIIARLFSSSKQFHIPSPTPILTSPSLYDPPTVISVSPDDDWLFAYFPGGDGDGTGCLWKRDLQVDKWTVKEWWSFARGAGVVAAEWAGVSREWATTEDGSQFRRPPRGPPTPISGPTLLLVTQAHELNVCYFRHYVPTLKVLSCSLTQATKVSEQRTSPINDAANGLGGAKLCVSAAIGLGYDESSILVAMRSHIIPSVPPGPSSYNTMNLGLSLDIPEAPSSSESTPVIEWESWGEESTIELCEVQLGFEAYAMTLSTNPLPSFRHSMPHLTNLTFICAPFPRPDPTRSPIGSPAKGNKSGRPEDTHGYRIYLAAGFLDFEDYTSIPKSELALYSLSRNLHSQSTSKAAWSCHLESARSFSPDVLAFCIPHVTSLHGRPSGLYAGILTTSGIASSRKDRVKDVPVGRVVVLKLPNLSEDSEREHSPILSSRQNIGDLPFSAAVSPNHTLLSTISCSLLISHAAIHPLPRHKFEDSSHSYTSQISSAVVCAIQTKRSTADITHSLALPSVTIDRVVDILHQAAALLQVNQNGLSDILTWDFIGLLVEIYGYGALGWLVSFATFLTVAAGRGLDALKIRQQEGSSSVAVQVRAMSAASQHAIWVLIHAKTATVMILAVWQLVGLSGWLTDFVEDLMKHCVMISYNLGSGLSTTPKVKEEGDDGDDLFSPATPSPIFDTQSTLLKSPRLLHLIHPYALGNLREAINHVKSFRDYLGSMSARGENAQIARDILTDLVDYSGVNLSALQALLNESIQDAKTITVDDGRRSLAQCHPTPAMAAHLRRTIQKLAVSSIVDKPRLFVKPSDLVDGVSKLAISERPSKETDRDIVSKALLIQRGPGLACARCGGKSEVGGDVNIAGRISLRWQSWEKIWTTRCVCGGLWTRRPL